MFQRQPVREQPYLLLLCRHFWFLALVSLLLVNPVGCSTLAQKPDPAQTVEKFLAAASKGQGQEAVDYICESMLAPELEELMRQLPVVFTYETETVESDETTAQVRVTGQIEFKLGPIIGKKMIDGSMALSGTKNGWCIERDSLGTFFTESLNTK